ncbi:hypothetical protein AERO8C_120349 [Aeromonas veronii]|uniref:Uncharacterized protein n=1 Tax=Aeromonas veronii TaxID=654 RepID=A0A653KS22_AERVE|nr:hypothetical protein AERO8C_120349 [Aeromonas veronii]
MSSPACHCARGLVLLDIELLQGDDRLSAVLDPQFSEDGGDMGLDGGLGDIELPGDLFVEAAVAQHDQHLVLLGGEAGQLAGEIGAIFRFGMERDAFRHPVIPPDHRIEGVDQLLHRYRLGNKAERPKPQHLLYDGRIFRGGDHHDGQVGILAAQVGQPLEAISPRHLEIEQQQVDLGVLAEQAGQAVDGVRFQQLSVVDGHVHRLVKGAPKQGVVICDDDGKLAVHISVNCSHCC